MRSDELRVRVTHLPSGESCEVERSTRWDLFRPRDLALRVIRSRLWARANGAGRSDAEVASYEIPDGEEADGPHDLAPYRKGPPLGHRATSEDGDA